MFFSFPVLGEIESPVTVNDIVEDGWTRSDTVPRTNTTNFMSVDKSVVGGISFIPWVDWNITDIPDTATIYAVRFRYRAYNSWPVTHNISWREYDEIVERPRDATPTEIVGRMTTGEPYFNTTIAHTAGQIYTVILGGNAISNFTDALARDWFAIGARQQGLDLTRNIYTSEGGYSPRLLVDTDQGTYTVFISGVFYENGTRAPAQNVYVYENGTTEEIEINGLRVLGYSSSPDQVSWGLTGGGVRKIYLPKTTENITIFIPEDTYALYQFSVIDYTGSLGKGTAHIEQWRSVNGTEQLIERVVIPESLTDFPVYCVVNEVYRIYALWSDLTSYDAGYWVPDTDYDKTVVFSRLTFSQKAQMTYKYISVEAVRVNSTHIRVNYEDTAPTVYGTDWANITITLRNGTVIDTFDSSSESFSYNWYGADNETDYYVNVDVDHGFFSNTLTVWKLLDYSRSYSAFPSLEILGTWGGMNALNLLSVIMIIATFGIFTRESAEVGLLSAFSLAGLLRMMGANTIPIPIITLGFALSVAYAVYRGRVKI